MESKDLMISVEHLKWLLSAAVAGYPVLIGFIWYLLKQLIKSKDEENETLKEIIPLSNKLTDVCQNMLVAINALTHKKGSGGK